MVFKSPGSSTPKMLPNLCTCILCCGIYINKRQTNQVERKATAISCGREVANRRIPSHLRSLGSEKFQGNSKRSLFVITKLCVGFSVINTF